MHRAGSEMDERQRQVRRAAAEHLALGMKAGRLSIRGVVRLTVDLFDLLYLLPRLRGARAAGRAAAADAVNGV